ncbi:MAG TPA: hypothetical protein VMW20_07230 [Candidatus Nanoarchaeia archaeon]|nr:hypothetical protein [Candidatus Nanoarchaeia archaeon]
MKKTMQCALVIVIWCFMIVFFMYQLGEAAEKSKVVVIPEKSKEILVITDKDTYIMVDLETDKTTVCVSDDGTVIICTD